MKEASGQAPMDEFELKRIIKDMLYKIKRSYVKKKLFGKIGFVIETEDKLICYIQKERCTKKKYYLDGMTYYISCNDFKKGYKNLVEKYGLDKKIVYVLDGMDFKESVIIKGQNCDLEIKNCNFSGNVEIRNFGNCTIRNTNMNPIDIYGEICIEAHKILIDNLSIGQIDNDNKPYFRKAHISGAKLVEIENSKIEIGDITLGQGTKCINMQNSILSAKDISIWSQKLSSKSSRLIANNKLGIKIEDFDSLKVKTPFIHFDGVLLNHRDGSKFYSLKPTNEKHNYRRAIIEQLKEIKGNLEEQRQQILDGVGKQIDSQRVARLYQRVRKQRGQSTTS